MAKKVKKPAAVARLTVQRVALARINAAPYNPRKSLKPGDDEYKQLKRSLGEYGYVDSLVWNKRTGHLVAGHQRLRILVDEFGMDAFDVSVVDLPLIKEKALNLALNKIRGEWDDAALAKLLLEVTSHVSAGTLTGFTDTDLEAMALQRGITTELKPIDTKPPPAMAWALIGIPTARFGRIADTLTKLSRIKDIVIETTVNDG